ncbi:hypothetical protein L228DRAFT_121700 [Xylona heveae TC161]|uniref:Uncharacterized protein n=1 Tax=Xylona heveae (strain CBS 132557 / TC161) TaxID=1328760 RepID=A0A165HKB6_XYLHT|nr:hypothetical protein L228DRAFT_121700 [Xylona heveae TC161]KZF23641.1 hypothetical protein L228DRAFT_121700 [Xylona heveae TC161]
MQHDSLIEIMYHVLETPMTPARERESRNGSTEAAHLHSLLTAIFNSSVTGIVQTMQMLYHTICSKISINGHRPRSKVTHAASGCETRSQHALGRFCLASELQARLSLEFHTTKLQGARRIVSELIRQRDGALVGRHRLMPMRCERAGNIGNPLNHQCANTGKEKPHSGPLASGQDKEINWNKLLYFYRSLKENLMPFNAMLNKNPSRGVVKARQSIERKL